jgi:hypothetical protein
VDGRDKPGHDASRLPRVPGSSFEFTLSTDIAIRASILLDKIRNMFYMFLLTESILARRRPGPGEERPQLFENLPDHNPTRELKGGRGFPYLNRPQPIEKARFRKINASKR